MGAENYTDAGDLASWQVNGYAAEHLASSSENAGPSSLRLFDEIRFASVK